MRILGFLLVAGLLFKVLNLEAQPVVLDKVRDQFFEMGGKENGAMLLYESLKSKDLTTNPVLLAYRGAASAAAAGSADGVRRKLEFFNKGKAELEKAVGLRPLDAEIRFLRLATQLNAPGFLGYSGDIKADKSVIIKTLSSVPANHPNSYLYQRICSFMLDHTELDATEKTTFSQLLSKFNTKRK